MLQLPGESRDITIAGIRVRYIEAGQGTPVLLVHGLGASVATWRDNIKSLSENHRVYALDLPGHGDSEKPDIAYDADSMIAFLKEFIEALGHQQVALVGNSLGGGLCVLTALGHPEIVSKLVLTSSGALGRDVAMILRLTTLPKLGEFMTGGPIDSTKFVLRKSFYDRSFASGDLLDELRRTSRLPGAREAVLKIMRNFISLWGVKRKYVVTRQLRQLQMPTLLFWGANDEIIPVKHAHRAARYLSQSDIHIFGECGHWSHMERSQEFNRLTLEFLAR